VSGVISRKSKYEKYIIFPGINLEIESRRASKNPFGIHYIEILELQPITHNRFHLKIPEHNDTGFTVFQVHCYHFNVTISLNERMKNHQNGTNLGFVLFKNHIVHLFNFNLNSVQCLFASIVYDKFAPIPGGCNEEENRPINPTVSVKITHNLLSTTSAPGRKSLVDQCDNQELKYETHYLYLEQDDFLAESYFNGIKKMLFGDLSKFSFRVKLTDIF
jgi:hypothetical protein